MSVSANVASVDAVASIATQWIAAAAVCATSRFEATSPVTTHIEFD